MTFHKNILEILLTYREKHPDFNFICRQRDRNGKFSQGYYFQGNDEYAFIGIIDRSGGANMTRSGGVVAYPVGNGYEFHFEIVHKGEKNQELLNFYKSLRSVFPEGTDMEGNEKYIYHGGSFSKENPKELYDFLDQYYPQVQELCKNSPFDDLIISDDKYEKIISIVKGYLTQPNYWIFQGNPELYDITAALRAGHLKSWKVAAHRDSIKKEDKVILWQTGKSAGCYALGEVISEVNNIEDEPVEIQYYRGEYENHVGLRVKIRITNYSADNPVYWKDVKDARELSEFKAGNQGTNFTATATEYNYFKNKIRTSKVSGKSQDLELSKQALNQILYGPPGTGKTYTTKEKAVRIAHPNFFNDDLEKSREAIIDKYNRLCEDGQIVFTTFHQSLSYEDFVEGIKPIMNGKKLSYQVEPGIFKSICEKAENDWQASTKGGEIHLPFDEAFSKLREEWEEDNTIQFSLKTPGSEYTILDFTDTSIYFKKASGGTGHTLSIATLRKAYHGEKKINPTGVGIYYPGVIKKLKSYGTNTSRTQAPLKSYVLIIDEINRGNVSSIFGELITLLEADKRLGQKEEIKVKLPYSKHAQGDFGVPPNLYIIGTMNTADRSVEALDTALRRRFSFEEIMPQPELFAEVEAVGINLREVLETINLRIEALLDRDHTIGHSYFFKVKDAANKEEALKQVFKDNIIPLLQEYFYGDYSRIGLVLGEGFVKQAGQVDDKIFAKFKDTNDSVEISERYELIPINEQFNIGKALEQLTSNA